MSWVSIELMWMSVARAVDLDGDREAVGVEEPELAAPVPRNPSWRGDVVVDVDLRAVEHARSLDMMSFQVPEGERGGVACGVIAPWAR